MFAMLEPTRPTDGGSTAASDVYPLVEEWDCLETLRREKAALGCYVSGNPLHRYGGKPARIGATPTQQIASAPPWSPVSVAGMVEAYQEKVFRGGGGRVAFFEIEDEQGRVQARLRGERIETYSAVLTAGDPVLVSGKVSFPVTDDPGDEREPTLLVDSVEPLAATVLRATRSVSIRLRADRMGRKQLVELADLLKSTPGACPVEVVLKLPDGAEAVLALESTQVTPDDSMLSRMERLFGDNVVELI
jgi:DNA polymerase-3 subunit alpha